MGRILGIDLGTTNSAAAVMDNGRPLVIPCDGERYILPSVVAFAEDGRILVGRQAKRYSVRDAANTVIAAKRLMGLSFDDPRAKQAIDAANYECMKGPAGDVRIKIRDRAFAVAEISAFIIAEIKRCAEEHLHETIDRAVITVPAYFNDFQRQATRDAGRIAGLEVLRILNEPTAAALCYGALKQGGRRRLVVYDLGGGTFDVSLLAIDGDVIEVIATAGDAFLGGRDFDQRIVDWVIRHIEQEHNVSIANDSNALQRVWEAAEAAKVDLSDKDDVTLNLPFLTQGPDGAPLHVSENLDRKTYESLVKDLVDRTLTFFTNTVSGAGMTPKDLDEVILVGGMTRMPLVTERVREIVGRIPSSGVHPDLVVAVGAAVQADILSTKGNSTVLVDVTPHNLGISTVAGLAETVIPKDTAIPVEAHRIFTTVQENQEQVRIVVYQGDGRRMEQNQVLGQFVLSGIRQGPRGSVQVDVCFQISSDGIVAVSARDPDTGVAQAIQIQQSHTLAQGELERMIRNHGEALRASAAVRTVEAAPVSVASEPTAPLSFAVAPALAPTAPAAWPAVAAVPAAWPAAAAAPDGGATTIMRAPGFGAAPPPDPAATTIMRAPGFGAAPLPSYAPATELSIPSAPPETTPTADTARQEGAPAEPADSMQQTVIGRPPR